MATLVVKSSNAGWVDKNGDSNQKYKKKIFKTNKLNTNKTSEIKKLTQNTENNFIQTHLLRAVTVHRCPKNPYCKIYVEKK